MADATTGLDARLAAVAEAAAELRTVLERFEGVVEAMRAGLAQDRGPLDLYVELDWAGARDQLFAAQDRFNRAYDLARAGAVRQVVDEEGASLTEVARTVGRSRQFVTRLYRLEDPPAG